MSPQAFSLNTLPMSMTGVPFGDLRASRIEVTGSSDAIDEMGEPKISVNRMAQRDNVRMMSFLF